MQPLFLCISAVVISLSVYEGVSFLYEIGLIIAQAGICENFPILMQPLEGVPRNDRDIGMSLLT